MDWDEIEGDPEYKALPDAEKARVKTGYFDDNVAPNVPKEHVEAVRNDFMAYKPIPSARDQYVKAAGKLLAHASLVARNAASDILDPVGRSLSDLSEKAGLKADTPLEAMGEASKAQGYKANAAEIAINPLVHSQDIVERLTKSAHEAAIQFGIKPTDEERTQSPNLAALGPLPMKAMRAFQALIDTSLPEVQALGKWIDMKELPLTGKIDSVINHSKHKTALEAAAIAPVEDTDHEIPKFDLALRTAYEVPNQLVHGAAEMARAMLNPVTAVEAEAMGHVGGLMAKGLGEVVARTAPEAGLRVMLSDVNKLGESSTARLGKKKLYTVEGPDGPVLKSDWSNMDHVHEHVSNQTNAALEGVQERMGATPEAMAAAAKAADRAGYEAVFRHLAGLKPSGVPTNLGDPPAPMLEGGAEPRPREIGMDGARGDGFTVDANPPQPTPRRVYNPKTGLEEAVPPKVIPTEPADIAAQTIGAGALNEHAGRVARDYPSLYAAAMGAEVPPAAAAELAQAMSELEAKGVKQGPFIDMLKEGVETGKASFVRLARVNDVLFRAALTTAGALPETLGRHAADAYTAAQRPGETLVAHAMEVDAEKAAVLARAKASQDVWAEAHREMAETEAARAPKPPAAPESEAADTRINGAEHPNQDAEPLPPRAEAMAASVENGAPLEEAAAAHREHALAAQEAGTLDPAIAAEYKAAGDDSFDPAALEAQNQAFPNPAKHPSEMTWEEFQAEYPGMGKDTHRAIVEEAAHHAEMEARAERAEMMESAGISAQPAHDLLRGMPIGDEWVEKLGLGGEFANSKGKGITAKGGIKVDYAVGRLIEAGILPEGASVNDMLDLLDAESRKGTKASSEASMVREDVAPERPSSSGGRGPARSSSSSPISVDQKITDVKARAEDWLAKEASARGMEHGDAFTNQFAVHAHARVNEMMAEMGKELRALKEADRQVWYDSQADDARMVEAEDLHEKMASIAEAYPEVMKTVPHDPAEAAKLLEGFKPVQHHTNASPAENLDLSAISPAVRDSETGELFTGPSHAAAVDAVMASTASAELKRRILAATARRTDDAGFKDVDGNFITRGEALKKYGFSTSEGLNEKRSGGSIVKDDGEEFMVSPPKKLYRGTADGGDGRGIYSLGKGLYSTPSKTLAKTFGNVEELSPEKAFPRNPLVVQETSGNPQGSFHDWLLKESGEKNIREFNKKWPDPGDFVRSKGYDGVVVGDEVVKYSTQNDERVFTPAFKKWFGKSKVVDGGGQPLVVYHGSQGRMSGEKIEKFDLKMRGNSPGSIMGFWFASTKKAGESFATERYAGVDPELISAYLSIENPKEYKSYESFLEDAKKENGTRIVEQAKNLRKKLIKSGHDGIVIRNSETDMGGKRDDFVAFKPEQIKSATKNSGDFDPTKASIVEDAPAFYSKLERDVEAKMGKSATVEQVRALLRDQKADEVEWTGISDFLEGKKTVTKAEVLDHLRANRLEVTEVMKGGPNGEAEAGEMRVRIDDIEREFSKDGKNFLAYEHDDHSGQVLVNGSNVARNAGNLTDDQHALMKEYEKLHEKLYAMDDGEGGGDGTKFASYTLPGGENYRELLLTMPSTESSLLPDGSRVEVQKDEVFHSSHFDEANILAHVRFNDRIDAAGKKVLFIEEVQSDWHQKGRREGYKTKEIAAITGELEAAKKEREALETKIFEKTAAIKDHVERSGVVEKLKAENKELQAIEERVLKASDRFSKLPDDKKYIVPDAPFKKTWHEFALKRMIRYAAENGYDKIAWTTGEQQAERYDLSKQVDSVHYTKDGAGYKIWATDKRGERVEIGEHPAERLADVVGKDLADKIVAGKGEAMPLDVWRGGKHPEGTKTLSGVDLKVGGEGMKGFYDKIVPSFMNKFGKKFGAQVVETVIDTGERAEDVPSRYTIGGGKRDGKQAYWYDVDGVSSDPFPTVEAAKEAAEAARQKALGGRLPVHSMPITDALRESALADGFTLFDKARDNNARSLGPNVDIAALKKEVVSDLSLGGSGEVAGQFVKEGKVDYVGKTVSTQHDMAEIVASLRHTGIEHDHFVVMKKGRVVGYEVITSGLPNAILITDEQLARVRALADSLGADEIREGHNHPSHDPTPSTADNGAMARNLRILGPRYKGMVVTNDVEFAVIGPSTEDNPSGTRFEKFRHKLPRYSEASGSPLRRAEDYAAEAFKNSFDGKSHTVLYLDARKRVIQVESVGADANVPATVKAGVLRNKASHAAIVSAKPDFPKGDLPFEAQDVVHVDAEGRTVIPPKNFREHWRGMGRGPSAYGAEITSSFLQDSPADPPTPRYMGGEGMSPEDFAASIAEKKIGPGSPVTLRVKLEGIAKGTKGKVMAVGQKTQTIMVMFEGEIVPRAVRAENLAETNRKPAARLAVEAAEKASRTSGKPSQPTKRTVSDQQEGLAKQPPTVTEKTALKGSLEAEARGAKTADALARKEMRAKLRAQERAARAELGHAQKNLRHAVQEAQMSGRWEAATRAKVVEFAKAFLPPSERGALLTKVADAKTNNDLLEAFHYIDQKANAYANKQAMRDVRVLVDRALKSKSFPIAVKLQIEDLISDIRLENWSDSTIEKVAAQQALIVAARAAGADVDVPQAVLDQVGKLLKRPLAELDGVEVADILADLRFLIERGREIKDMAGELKELDREAALADLVAGTKKVYVKPSTGKGVKRAFGGPALTWAQEAKNRWLGNADMAQAAGIYLRPVQAIMDDLDGTFLGGGPNRREWERLQSAFIDAKAYSQRKRDAFAEAIRKVGPLNQQEIDRVWIVGFSEMPDVRPHLHKMGLGDDEIDAVKLTPKEQALLNAMRAPFQGQEEIAKLRMVAATLNNAEFVQVENYLPIKTKYVPSNPNTSAKEILANEVAMRRKSPDRGMLIERVSGAAREFRTDLGVIEDAIEGQAAIMHMAIPLLRAHSVFTDPAYEAAAGDAAVDFWRDYIDALARNGAFPKSKVERVLAKAMSNLGTAALAFKPNVALMQLSSLGPGSTLVGGGFVRRAIFAGSEWDGFVDQHMPLVKGRQGGDPAVRDVMHGGLLPKVAEAGFKAMVAGDHWTAVQVALGAYFQFLDRAGIPADPQKPHPPALRYAQSIPGRTMASPWLIDMPLALSRGGVVVKSALQFQGETLAKFSLTKDLAADAGENPARSSAAAGYLGAALLYEAGVRWAWRGFVMAGLYALGAIEKKQFDRFMEKDNAYWKQAVAAAANGIPFVGAVSDAIMYDAGPIPVVNTTIDALAGIGNGVVGVVNGKPVKAARAIVQGMTALASLAGVPGAGVVGWIAKQSLRGKSDAKKGGGYKP